MHQHVALLRVLGLQKITRGCKELTEFNRPLALIFNGNREIRIIALPKIGTLSAGIDDGGNVERLMFRLYQGGIADRAHIQPHSCKD